jgi:tRNA(Ile)-lysidine synthase
MKKLIAEEVYNRISSLNIEIKHFLLAISGGSDSMLMLDIFLFLKTEYEIKFSVCHLNHRLRDVSDKEMQSLEQVFKDLNIDYNIGVEDVNSYKRDKKISLEMAAHDLRYRFFELSKKKLKTDILCTAHHQGDHIESILMNLFRGAGIDGIQGLNEYSGEVFKPIFYLDKKKIQDYTNRYQIEYFIDESNNDLHIERNFWRKQIVKRIKDYYGQSYEKGLLRSIENVKWTEYDLDLFNKKLKFHLESRSADGKLVLEIDELKEYISQFLKRMFDKLLSHELEKEVKLSHSDFQNVVNLIHHSNTGKYLEFLMSIRVEKSFDKLIIYKKKTEALELKIEVEKEYQIKNHQFEIKKVLKNTQVSIRSEMISGDKLSFPLMIKNVSLTESFDPLGIVGKQKVNRFLKSNKIHKADREEVLALYNNNEIVAILGMRIAEKYKVTEKTKKKYSITYNEFN